MTTTINGRTPEEIKKGLEHCATEGSSCKGCAFCADCDVDIYAIERYALAYIQQLERERDAAVEDLEEMGNARAYCDTCLYANSNSKEEPCSSCMSGYLINNWQWRGVQEVE